MDHEVVGKAQAQERIWIGFGNLEGSTGWLETQGEAMEVGNVMLDGYYTMMAEACLTTSLPSVK